MFTKLKLLTAVLGLSVISFTALADNIQNNNDFPPTIQVKDQQWNLKNVGGNSSTKVATYVAPNDVANNNPATKIIIQKIKLSVNKGIIPAAVAENEINALTKTGHKASVIMIESRPLEAIADLHIETKPGQPREDIQRIIFNPDHTFTIIMHYGMNGEMNPTMRNDMIKVLKDINPPL